MNSSSGVSPARNLRRLGLEVVELPLEDRDHVPGDVLEDLGVRERAALGGDGTWLHCERPPDPGVGPGCCRRCDCRRRAIGLKPSGFQVFIQGSRRSTASDPRGSTTPSSMAARRQLDAGAAGCSGALVGAEPLERGDDRGRLLGGAADDSTARRRRALALGASAQSGMLPCLRLGPGSRLLWSVCSAVISFGRVSWGTITSSM